MTTPVGPPPRSWHAALLHPGIESIEDYRHDPAFRDSPEESNVLVTLGVDWALGGDLTTFWVCSLADLREQWQDIQPTGENK